MGGGAVGAEVAGAESVAGPGGAAPQGIGEGLGHVGGSQGVVIGQGAQGPAAGLACGPSQAAASDGRTGWDGDQLSEVGVIDAGALADLHQVAIGQDQVSPGEVGSEARGPGAERGMVHKAGTQPSGWVHAGDGPIELCGEGASPSAWVGFHGDPGGIPLRCGQRGHRGGWRELAPRRGEERAHGAIDLAGCGARACP